MAEVTVTINGRSYKMACDNGQERHLLSLADHVGRQVEHLKTSFGQVGDTRLLLMASGMLTAEWGERGRKVDARDAEIQRMRNARENVLERLHDAQNSVARTINSAAERIEALTGRMNGAED